MTQAIHKYVSSDIYNILGYCGKSAWCNGSRYWKAVTCKICLAYKPKETKRKN